METESAAAAEEKAGERAVAVVAVAVDNLVAVAVDDVAEDVDAN